LPPATLFRNIRESLISLFVGCLHHKSFPAAGVPADIGRQLKAAHAALAVFFEVDAALNDYSARAGRNPRLRT
jgi:hypothetical protein